MRGGQARFIEYVLIVLFGMMILVGFTTLIYNFYREAIATEIREEMKQLALLTSDEIVKLYQISRQSKALPANYSSILIRETDLKLPSQIANRNYEMFLVLAGHIWSTVEMKIDGRNVTFVERLPGAKVVLRTTQDPEVELEHDIPNIDIIVGGRSENGRDPRLSYYRYNINGTIYDVVFLGAPEILITISSVS